MDDKYFRQLFEGIVEAYQLSPETAAELLQRILEILSRNTETEEEQNGNHNSS